MTRIALAAAFIMTAGAALADPAEGVWQTVPDDNGHFGHIEIAPCGPALCGTLVRAYDVSGAEIASHLQRAADAHGLGASGRRLRPGHLPRRRHMGAGRLTVQGRQFRKLAMSRSPAAWLFSGWNWVPTIVSRPTMAVISPP